ncbi:prolyl oligopeptidase family serine peptidase [Tundrisphaera lichenicola]|uniref:alpha/beta hydrolase n=1 Tax=Tundrisphaera lichenicola TaxID=2029860 RepID=UPI003EBDDC8B
MILMGGVVLLVAVACGIADDEAERPGDRMIRAYLASEANELDSHFLEGVEDAEAWEAVQARSRDEYLSMLGLSPIPPRTPLHATVTGTVEGDGFTVELLHYQSMPGLYVTANLYRPSKVEPGARLPAVLYVCGHSGMGRDGVKAAFQSHGIWFARHGYICLVVDTLQLGEIPGIHHGTYREGRWWWHSRGYTPAGVECWNGIRGLDYLTGRPDVDPDRLAVTGISGGGAATYWIAAADDRIKVAVPVSGMADLQSYVANKVVDGHCDCMFLYNSFQWPWTRIAGLIAPRPMLFVNSDDDAIFPMDANERVIARLEQLYSLFGAGDRVDAVVSVGGHDYRKDIRQSAYRFLNSYLKADPKPVMDSEVDLIKDLRNRKGIPIDPAKLRVFPTDADLPTDRRNGTIDRDFVPMAQVELPTVGEYDAWKDRLLGDLRRLTFHSFPDRIPPARPIEGGSKDRVSLETEGGIVLPLQSVAKAEKTDEVRRIILVVSGSDEGDAGWFREFRREGDAIELLQPRGIGATRWSDQNPPNYVRRAHALLGRTVDGGRVQDVAAVARYLHALHGGKLPIVVAGEGSAGVIAAYAALLEPEIGEVILSNPPGSHMDPEAPALLNVLRTLDIPEALGMLAPRPILIRGQASLKDRVATIYRSANAANRFDGR